MVKINEALTPKSLLPKLRRLFELSAEKIAQLQSTWDPGRGAPVYTVNGKYTSRGWTEWTLGFQYGSAILHFDATGEKEFLELGRAGTVEDMAVQVTNMGVHDHGFNNVSTYGNLLRLMGEGRIADNAWERSFYELALKTSGAVQAARWTVLSSSEGFIHSFNGPHSLFVDTLRSLRSLALAHQLGHALIVEGDRRVSLLDRLLQHAEATCRYNIYFGEGRDAFDVRGRVAHESIFNVANGSYRCPSTQQGYSPFSTWTRGLAWALCGLAEELEFIRDEPVESLAPHGGKDGILKRFRSAAEAVADYYLESSPTDGIPYWDTGAPGLAKMPNCLERPADPFNEYEPVDSSAAAIVAQGFLRLGTYLRSAGDPKAGDRYVAAGLTIVDALLAEPYLSAKADHQGLILHSVYHRPNGWDHVPSGRRIPCGESSMWGDYHARELGLMLLRETERKPYLAFYASK